MFGKYKFTIDQKIKIKINQKKVFILYNNKILFSQ